jgi:hypothetical protein
VRLEMKALQKKVSSFVVAGEAGGGGKWDELDMCFDLSVEQQPALPKPKKEGKGRLKEVVPAAGADRDEEEKLGRASGVEGEMKVEGRESKQERAKVGKAIPVVVRLMC